jgi:hypothetical protein
VCLFGVSSLRLLSLRCVSFFRVRFFRMRCVSFFSVRSMCLFSVRCVHFRSVCIVPFGFVPCRIETNHHHDQTDYGQSSGENFGFLSKNKHRRRHLN